MALIKTVWPALTSKWPFLPISPKTKLFKNTQFSILNLDDSKSYDFLKSKVGGKLTTYCLKGNADFTQDNTRFKLKIPGSFNLENALAAAAACQVLEVNKR